MTSTTPWLDRLMVSMKWANRPPLPADHYDVIVIGGGHNGLTCATYLARDGKKVLLLEANEGLGGGCQTGPISKDAVASRVAHISRGLHPRLIGDLRLNKFGYKVAVPSLDTVALDESGNHLTFGQKMWQTGGAIVDHSEVDAEAFSPFFRKFERWQKLARQWQLNTPESPVTSRGDDGTEFQHWVGNLKGANRKLLQELARIVPGSVSDYLNTTFETDLLKGALALDGVLGTGLGPRSAGSMWHFIRGSACMGGGLSLPKGGMGALTEAMSRALEHYGGEFRCGQAVDKILIEKSSVVGVSLAGGEIIFANAVVSAINPRHAMLELIGARHLETEVVRPQVNRRCRGSVAKLNLSLSRMPSIVGYENGQVPCARFLIAPSLDYLESAYVACRKGDLPDQPPMELVFPTKADTTLSAQDRHVATIIIEYVPYDIEGGWDNARERLTEKCAQTLAKYMPDLERCIVGGELLTPVDIENEFGLPGGHWHGGDLHLSRLYDQRPVGGAANYRLPIDGLYLCGAGCHPQGGVNGISAYNAYQAMRHDERNAAKAKPGMTAEVRSAATKTKDVSDD